MNPIGGYFSLELPHREEFHKGALRLNTGRNCLEYILRARNYSKVYIPYYTCDVLLEPFRKLDVKYEYYRIDRNLEMADTVSVQADEALLYTNYFGLKQDYVEQLAREFGSHLIIDDTQAFYAKAIEGVDTFYSCRKFFGVPDGAYLYTDARLEIDLPVDVSNDRMAFLLKRIDLGAEAGYVDFRQLGKLLAGQPVKRMSNLTRRLMCGIDYEKAARRRQENYQYLHNALAAGNHLQLRVDAASVPMVYPYLIEDRTVKARLISNKVFVATYWPNVLEWCKPEDWEYNLAERTVFLPVDQRYGPDEMNQVINLIHSL